LQTPAPTKETLAVVELHSPPPIKELPAPPLILLQKPLTIEEFCPEFILKIPAPINE
jgi:hypothetical protein